MRFFLFLILFASLPVSAAEPLTGPNQKMYELLTKGAPFPDDIRDLVKDGADLNVIVPETKCPLYFAYLSGWPRGESSDSRIVNALIKAGADMKAVCEESRQSALTALGNSRFRDAEDHKKAVELALAAGADPNAADRDGNSVLFTYVRNDREALLIDTLIKAKANVTFLDREAHSLLYYAVRTPRVFKSLYATGARLSPQDNRIKNRWDVTVMMQWLRSGGEISVSFAESLLKSGALIKDEKGKVIRDERGWTPLMFLAGEGRANASSLKEIKETIAFLLKQGMSLEDRSVDDYTPLMLAVNGAADEKIMQALLELGADANAVHRQTVRDMFKVKDNGRFLGILDGFEAQKKPAAAPDKKGSP